MHTRTLYVYVLSLPPFHLILLYIIRLQLAALHFNENANRKPAVTKMGEEMYDIIFPKYKKGSYVVRKVMQDPSYGKLLYIDITVNLCYLLL